VAFTAEVNTGGILTVTRVLTALAISFFCASLTAAKEVYVAGSARDPGVEHWISYQIKGPSNHPYPIVYLSTRHFETMPAEFLIVLPPARYDIVSAYTEARIARPDCPGEEPAGNVWYSVEIAEHESRHTKRCIIPQADACDYLSGVLRLPGIEWTADEQRPIDDFMLEVKCKNPRG
jgi:hypothetical protein